MDRRRFLAASLPLSAVLAGCLGNVLPGGDAGSGDPTTGHPTTQDQDPTTSLGAPGVDVTGIVVRKAVAYHAWAAGSGVLAPRDRQYVVAGIAVDESIVDGNDAFPIDADCRLRTDETTYETGVEAISSTRYARIAGMNWIFAAFDVPSPLSTADASIRYDGPAGTAAWTLTDEQVATLGAPTPAFELVSWDAPESVTQGDPVPVSLTVRNVSETNGRFLAALRWPTEGVHDDREAHPVATTVPAGETATVEHELDSVNTSFERGPVTLSLEGYVTAERTVEVVSDTTTGSESAADRSDAV